MATTEKAPLTSRRLIALAVPVAVLFFALGFVVGLEVQRGPNWRLELEDYVAEHRSPGDAATIETVARARRPDEFSAAMGTLADPGDIQPSSGAGAVRCVLLEWSRPMDDGDRPWRQVVFLVHHSDALYRVGWLAYEGPQEPFGPQLTADLNRIGCDLNLE